MDKKLNDYMNVIKSFVDNFNNFVTDYEKAQEIGKTLTDEELFEIMKNEEFEEIKKGIEIVDDKLNEMFGESEHKCDGDCRCNCDGNCDCGGDCKCEY